MTFQEITSDQLTIDYGLNLEMIQEDIRKAPIVRLYRKFAVLTIGAVVLLIGIGGIVRTTGSGMGCPDWPKCFGSWIPPTDVSQLPPNYQEIYKDHGYASMEFNAVKTWIEYINRLIGVLIGLVTLVTAAISLRLRKMLPQVTRMSVLALFMVIVQGGIGAYVVRTNLEVGLITIHMVVALGILVLLILAYLQSNYLLVRKVPTEIHVPSAVWVMGGICLIFLFTQVILGTQVREQVDIIAKQLGGENRNTWIAELGNTYHIHKYFYYGVLGAFIAFYMSLNAISRKFSSLRITRFVMGLLLVGEIALGIGMHHMGIPPWIQPLHLLFATCLVGLNVYLLGLLAQIRARKFQELILEEI
ncbi:MAG: COX15/CtaA family protein [Bacteroidota bacterium]